MASINLDKGQPSMVPKLPFKLNHRPSPVDERDHMLRVSATNPVKVVDLSNFCTSIKDQGSVGSCTAHAGVALMEYFYRKNMDGKIDDLFSEKFLYYTTRMDVQKGGTLNDVGAYLRDTLKSMVQFGVCIEPTFPYLKKGEKSSNFRERPSEEAYKEALNYQVTKYARVSETDKNQCLLDLKALLTNGNTFMGGFTCYQNIFDAHKGVIPLPAGKIAGGHAVLFVGFDDVRKVFKFKNSWGPNWGDKGYGYLPYYYLLSGNLSDLWTVYQQEYDNKPFDVIKPVNRLPELSNRINYLLLRATETNDVEVLLAEIKNNPDNNLLLAHDITDLQNFMRNLVSQVQKAKLGVN